MTEKQRYNALLAKKAIKEFEKRNIQGFYCETKEEALKKALEIIPKKSSVSWGGSITIHEVGLPEALESGEYKILDASEGKGGAEMDRIAHEALSCDYYIMSANAIAMTGELVNSDGIGNRVSSLSYGPKNVIVIAGINKVEQNLDAAIFRLKTRAAPLVFLTYDKSDVPSFEELLKKSEGIGSQLLITTMSIFKDRIKVILVGESLGF